MGFTQRGVSGNYVLGSFEEAITAWLAIEEHAAISFVSDVISRPISTVGRWRGERTASLQSKSTGGLKIKREEDEDRERTNGVDNAPQSTRS